jgi:PAS domain S-box-containing protein
MSVRSTGAVVISDYFDSILDVLSDGIYISDRDGKTLKINGTYEKLTGLTKEELMDRLVTDLVKEGKYDVALNPEIVKTGKAKTSVQINKMGRQVVLEGHPVFDKSGQVVLVVTFVRDITSLTQMKEQLAYQQELISRYNEVQCFKKPAYSTKVIAESKAMQKLHNLLNVIAVTDATVLLLGETGVGKDVHARKIHEKSSRASHPFFKVDCASIPTNLVESELFGYEAGAFSGANTKGKPGFFEMANKGTLFLDEIGELPLTMQAKLLRVLQDQEIIRVGSTKVKKVDVRFIAATNRDLEAAVREGTFRSDLYYRLQVAVVKIPPLRERKEDVLPLVANFLEGFNNKYRTDVKLSQEAEAVFENYAWPGNIREMENLVQSLIITNQKGIIEVGDLPNHMLPSAISKDNNLSLTEILDNIERELLKKALDSHESILDVAKYFKVDRTTIFRKIRKYGLIKG